MKFAPPLVRGTLLRRYKRFLADVVLDSGETITAHTANTGSMLGCAEPGSRVWLSVSDNPKRKYQNTWELVEVAGGALVCINTMRPNHLVREAIDAGVIAELQGYADIKAEQQHAEGWRADWLLRGHADGRDCLVEVKNVTLRDEAGVARFPDAKSERARRQTESMIELVAQDYRVVVLYCVPRADCSAAGTAEQIDPVYAETIARAQLAGVEVLAYRANVTPDEVKLVQSIPVMMSAASGPVKRL